jgi:preprotein translocase subunit YajC
MFSSPAWAQMPFGGGGGGGEALMQILPLVLIFVVFYFLLIRPQQKKSKEHKEMLGKLRRGDRVVTGGGIVGTVAKVPDSGDEISVDIAENVRVKVVRGTISAVVARGEPVKDEAAGEKPKVRAAGGK